MRTSLLLLAVAFFIACDDNAETTAPRTRTVTPSSANPALPSEYPPGPGHGVTIQPSASATVQSEYAPGPGQPMKPVPGFTTVTSVTSPEIKDIDGVVIPTYFVNIPCPLGATAVGGGYEVTNGVDNAHVLFSLPDGANGWMVALKSTNGTPVWFKVTAMCIQ